MRAENKSHPKKVLLICRRFFLLAAVNVLVVLLDDRVFASETPTPSGRVEEVRKSQQVGASELALRAAYYQGAVRKEATARVSLVVPFNISPSSVLVEVRDNKDIGYYMKPEFACSAAPACEYAWPLEKMRAIGIDVNDLWPIARVDDPNFREVVLPTCFCTINELTQRNSIKLVFVPSRAINVQFYISGPNGEILKDQRTPQPAGLPLELEFNVAPNSTSRYIVTIYHVAASGGAVERFADTYHILTGKTQ